MRRLFGVIAAALLAACGGGGDGGTGGTPATSPPAGSAVIGRDGGTVTSADGKVKLVIPAGALGNSETITIESIDPAKMPAPLAGADLAYDMKPDGLRFAQPAQISVALPNSVRQADGSINLKLGALVNSSRTGVEALGDQTLTVDGRNNTTSISGTLTHFSAVAFGNRLKAARIGSEVGFLTTTLNPIPDRLAVGTTYRASFEVAAEGFGASETVSGEFAYKDQSRAPLRHIPDMASIGPDSAGFFPLAGPPTLSTPARLGNYGDYVCDQPASAVVTDVQLRLANASLFLGYVDAEVPLQGLKVQWYYGHVCEFTGPPPPPPSPDEAFVFFVNALIEGVVMLATNLGATPEEISAIFGIPLEQVRSILVGAFANPGLRLIDIRNGQVARSKDLPGMPMFGVVPHLKDGKGCLFGYGSTTARTCYFAEINDFGFTEIGINVGPVTDAGLVSSTPVQTPTGRRHLLWYVGNGTVIQEYQESAGGEVQRRELSKNAPNSWYRSGGTATGKAQSAFFNANADRVLVVRGEPNAPGQLWFGNPADLTGGMLVGSLGANSNDTRKIRCALPICAVSSFGGLVSIVTWDGTNAPAIAGTIAGTTGAVGIDVAVEGANRTIRSADFTNNTVTKTIVTAAGQVVSSVTKAVPQGCTNPGHVTSFTDAGGQRKSVVSCNGRNAQGQSAVAVLTDAEFFGLQ